jgi:protein tyrosine/serine phosphatase
VYRGGQPSERGFLRLKQLGVRTILNLRDEGHYIKQEETLLFGLGLKPISVPLSPFVEPTKQEIDTCLNILKSADHHPVFVHCLHGQDRTGTIISIYRLDAHGWDIDRAYKEMIERGFHNEFECLAKAVHLFAHKLRSPRQD